MNKTAEEVRARVMRSFPNLGPGLFDARVLEGDVLKLIALDEEAEKSLTAAHEATLPKEH